MIRKKRINFFIESFLGAIQFLKESKNYIFSAVLIFFLFSLIGFLFPAPKLIEERLIEIIKELIGKTEGMDFFQITNYIFWNNIRSAFYSIIFGLFFGIFSAMVAIFNGYILGFVAEKSVSQGGILVLWRLLPHGIFELPALFIAIGIGMKLGSCWFKKDKIKNFINYFFNSLKVFFFIILPLFIIAAIIEGALISIVG